VEFKLLQTAKEFIASLDMGDIPLRDIVITGSNCNLTYTRYSDLDLHLRMNFDEMGGEAVVRELMQSKKALWNEHHDIKIRKIPVELYVEDEDDTVEGSVYSLLKDQWLQQKPLQKTQYDDVSVRAKYNDWKRRIELVLNTSEQPAEVNRIRDRLRQYRRSGLAANGEFSTENLVFKALRNDRLLDRLQQKKYDLTTDILSLPEYINQ
jgi:hypothetical protein